MGKSLGEVIHALVNVIKTLFHKMPVLFLVVIYLLELSINCYITAGLSIELLLCSIILITSLGIFSSTKSYSQTTLSFVLGILTVFTIDWEKANYKLFILIYFIYTIFIFYINAIRITAKQEAILNQAAIKLDFDNFDYTFKRLKEISVKVTRGRQLTVLEKSEIIRYLAFRQVIIGEYEESINTVEMIKTVCQISLNECCELYYNLYMYCKNSDKIITNVPKEIEKLIDKITTVPLAYNDFFLIFNSTKKVLYDRSLGFDKYIVEIKRYALQGYSAIDISDEIKNTYLC